MEALVFAAGLGTRLRPLTDKMPKALVPVCGKPLLYHVLSKLKSAGYSRAVVNVHHFASQIADYLSTHDFGMETAVSDESDCLLETGGGILHARTLLEPVEEPFLVHNVDILSNLDLNWFREQLRPDALSTLVVSERNTSRYLLFNDEMRLMGWTNVTTGEIRSPYPPEQLADCRRFAFSGIHALSPGIFAAMEACRLPARFPIMDFYLPFCDRFPIYGLVPPQLRLMDVGKVDSLQEAESFLVRESGGTL